MSSKLTKKDLRLLDASSRTTIGLKPYEDGVWGSQNSRDFVLFELYDENKNLIQFRNLPISEFVASDGIVEFFPGNHIRAMGYQSGVFNIKYNFLRRLAGDESAVLTHTINKSDTKIGDVYTQMDRVFVTPDGLIFASTEEEFIQDSSNKEALSLQRLKYEIDVISPSRKEIRLKAKNINGSYKDEFFVTSIPTVNQNVENDITFEGDLYESTILNILDGGDFKFTSKMEKASITINDVYKTDTLSSPATTEQNFVKNGDFEDLWDRSVNGISEIIMQGTEWPWDETLHDDAVRANEWDPGFQRYDSADNINSDWYGTQTIGYHAKAVLGEGRDGGTCFKFTDLNEQFLDIPAWPSEQRYRGLRTTQKMDALSSVGVVNGDVINLSMDVKSTVPNKGVRVMFRFANGFTADSTPPDYVPEGYYDPLAVVPGPTEDIPENPPDGIVTLGDIQESQPPATSTALMSFFNVPPPIISKLKVGDFDSKLGGNGSWKISAIEELDDEVYYTWSAVGVTNMSGEQSAEGQWVWDGTAWVVHPDYASIDFPVPPVGSVNNPKAVNHHPAQTPGQGTSHYPRTRFPGENAGWQAGTVGDLLGEDLPEIFLFKDDLVWRTSLGAPISKASYYTYMQTIEEWSESNVFRNNIVVGNDGVSRTLYDDIFETGFIQAVSRPSEIMPAGVNDYMPYRMRPRNYLIFYNDGRGEVNSNKFFQIERGDSLLKKGDGNANTINFLSDIDESLNDAVLENDNQLVVTFVRDISDRDLYSTSQKNYVHFFIVGQIMHTLYDTTGDLTSSQNSLNNPDKATVELFKQTDGFLTRVFFPHINASTAHTMKFMLPAKPWSLNFSTYEHYGAFIEQFGEGLDTIPAFFLTATLSSYKMPGDYATKYSDLDSLFPECGKRQYTGETGVGGLTYTDVTFGVRNPAANNYGIHYILGNDEEPATPINYSSNAFGMLGRLQTVILTDNSTAGQYYFGYTEIVNQNAQKQKGLPAGLREPVYQVSDRVTFDFDDNPTQDGVLSTDGNWRWSGASAKWESTSPDGPSYRYTVHQSTTVILSPDFAGEWQTLTAEIPVPDDWILNASWRLYIDGDGASTNTMQQGIVWIDNLFMNFTLTQQAVTRDIFSPFYAQIVEVISDTKIKVDKNIREVAEFVGAQDENTDGDPDVYNATQNSTFSSFNISFTNLNPRDLTTYLKFDNELFLTTNFKPDRLSVTNFPFSIVYKLYQPLPQKYERFDECIIVKEMSEPVEEKIKIIDFIPEEAPSLVLRSPDLDAAESPVQRRSTLYKTESDILTADKTISNELRNKFISQSLDSVELNTDYSQFKNFINFSSAEKRIRNFKLKMEDIESKKILSSSFVGVNGAEADIRKHHFAIEDVKNNFDSFEKYMYFESSSYVTSSLGEFFDNAWPKTSGTGNLASPYVLAHTTSSQAQTWFTNTINSASLYDEGNSSKLSSVIPEHIVNDVQNDDYIKFTDMIGHHFDGIWEYVNSLTDTFDRRDKLNQGISKDLLWSVGKSLGWNLYDGKDLIDLPRFETGKQVTGSAYSDYSATSERDVSREIWSRIINNMPFFLKNKGTVRALKGLINIYGIPSTILRVKEYGGPVISDTDVAQFEIRRKFTKALDFRGGQSVRTAWANDGSSGRKPDTIEFRFRAATGSNQILVEKQDGNNQDFFIRLKDNGSSDNYGFVSFMISGSKVGIDQGEYKEITSSALPIYDGDFYSVMVARTSGSDNVNVSQSYQLNVGKYDAGRSKIHLYSTSTMDVTQSPSASFSNAWTGSGDVFIGGQAAVTGVGARFSGSIMEYRHWTETLNTSSFKNHIANPKAYDGNSVSSSYENLVLRYSFDDNKNLTSDTAGIRDVSSNQTTTLSGSHSGFTGNFFRSVVDEQKTHIPSIGALRRSTNKVRIESNPILLGKQLNTNHRATDSQYDKSPNDSNKVGIFFAPTDVINNDIIDSVGDLNFEDYLGDPRDKLKLKYNGLNHVANNYWKKYTSPNNFWDYMRLIKYYDQSLFPQLKKMIPARAKSDVGLLIEPNIFERPKVIMGKTPTIENTYFSSSVNVGRAQDAVIVITGSFNHGSSISNYDAYTGRVDIYSYETGSSVVSSSGEFLLKEASGSQIRDSFIDRSIWQTLGEGDYSNVTMSFGDTLNGVKGGPQPVISGSRIYGVNKRTISFYSSSLSSSVDNSHTSSFVDSDLDNFSHLFQGLRNSFYEGVKNTIKTTSDGRSPVEVIISAPTKLVTTEEGDSTLTTGDGIVPEFLTDDKDEKEFNITFEEKRKKIKNKKRGLKGLTPTYETDRDRLLKIKAKQLVIDILDGKTVAETLPNGDKIDVVTLKEKYNLDDDESNDGVDDGVLNNEK